MVGNVILENRILINQLQNELYVKDQVIREQSKRPETQEVELQTSFEN